MEDAIKWFYETYYITNHTPQPEHFKDVVNLAHELKIFKESSYYKLINSVNSMYRDYSIMSANGNDVSEHQLYRIAGSQHFNTFMEYVFSKAKTIERILSRREEERKEGQKNENEELYGPGDEVPEDEERDYNPVV